MLFQRARRNNIKKIIFTIILFIMFTSSLQLGIHASNQIYTKINWIKNSDFSLSEDHWFTIVEGDNSDANISIHTEQGNFEIFGEEQTFSLIVDPPLALDWIEMNNSDFPDRPDIDEITSDGCRVSHNFNDVSAVQNPSVLWDQNITMPGNMTDYVIKSASIQAIVNATVDENLDRLEDYLTGDFARLDPNYVVDTYSVGDYIRFFILISDLERNKVYEIAYFQTEQIGSSNPPGKDYLYDTYMLSVPQEVLIFYLESVLGTDNCNFTISLGIRIHIEDNLANYWDLDNFDELYIKFVNLTFTYEKKIDRYTSLSLNQIGESINETNVEITDAVLNFKYKLSESWPDSLSPNSELIIFINNYEIGKKIKLNEMNTTFQSIILGTADLRTHILTDVNISVSIMILLADDFTLDRKITISVDDVYLEISYVVWIETTPPNNNLIWIALIISLIVIALLATLSFRSYIFQPRKQRKLFHLRLRTQKFKDINNIQGIILIHNPSGLPIFSRSYSMLMKGKKTIFSGFIQAISIIGEEFSKDSQTKSKNIKSFDKLDYHKTVELDLKKFQCLILDIEELRTVLILKSKSSKRLKQVMFNFTLTLYLKISKKLKNFDNDLADFPELITPLLDEYFELHYKENFITELHEKDIQTIKKEFKLTKIQVQIMITVFSILKEKMSFRLMNIVEKLNERNENSIIDAIESLIEKRLIFPYY